MCNVCGCGETGNSEQHHDHHHDDHHKNKSETLHFGNNAAGVTVAGVETGQLLELQTSLQGKNDLYAEKVRRLLSEKGAKALNLMSSPGAGKTTLLIKTLEMLMPDVVCQVIEGDQQTTRDADKVRATGAATLQINTGKGCHLDAHMVLHALEQQPPLQKGMVFIENVGYLVCPAGFDLGEQKRVVILSVTEGEDKPIKYPDAFYHADAVVLSKIDLLPYVDFDVSQCKRFAREINPDVPVFELSAKSGQGMEGWREYLSSILMG